MSTPAFERALTRLSRASRRDFTDPSSLTWPREMPADAWCFSPRLISLHGTSVWDSLSEETRRRLSFFEAVNFFSLNVHGEKRLITAVGRCLYRGGEDRLSDYLVHFIEEEAKHMMFFATFCDRYAGKLYPDTQLALAEEVDTELATLLLFGRIYLFEEIVDEFNLTLGHDTSLVPIVRAINRLHHQEETRHLAFGRRYLIEALSTARLDAHALASARVHLSGYLEYVWKQFANPGVYRDAGVPDPYGAWRASLDAQAPRARRAEIVARRLALLRRLDLLEDPS